MPFQEVTNISQGKPIHIDSTMILPGQTALIDEERAKSKPIKDMVAANWLQLGDVVDDEEAAPPAKPSATPAPAPRPPATPPKG